MKNISKLVALTLCTLLLSNCSNYKPKFTPHAVTVKQGFSNGEITNTDQVKGNRQELTIDTNQTFQVGLKREKQSTSASGHENDSRLNGTVISAGIGAKYLNSSIMFWKAVSQWELQLRHDQPVWGKLGVITGYNHIQKTQDNRVNDGGQVSTTALIGLSYKQSDTYSCSLEYEVGNDGKEDVDDNVYTGCSVTYRFK